ncbi:MAG: hypothetical protein H0W08_08730 [Acidobacteria bacterium]|nr:hypothetical protein [Acidobacteriota bacterium]
MEFVVVICDERQRPVFIDNQLQGITGTRLSVPEGVHAFDLGHPIDYAPPVQELTVENTTPAQPLPVVFSLVAAARESLFRPARRPRKRKRTRKSLVKKTSVKATAKSTGKRKKGSRRNTKRTNRSGRG